MEIDASGAPAAREEDEGDFEVLGIQCPRPNVWQKLLGATIVSLLVVLLVGLGVGYVYDWVEFVGRAVRHMSLPLLTLAIFLVMAALEVLGALTLLMATACGFLYRSRMATGAATLVATIVSFFAIVVGCVVAYALGRTVMREWSEKLFRKNRTLGALDSVLGQRGFVVNVLLRTTFPDSLINFGMPCTRCSFGAFLAGTVGMLPFIAAHCWFGALMTDFSDISKAGEGTTANSAATIVSAVAVLLLSGVVAFYAQRELAKLAGGELDAQAASRWSEVV